ITQAYGRYHTVLDNCQIVTSFAATDVETADTISRLAGDIFEVRPQETWSGKRQLFGLDHRAITYREERRPLLLPSEVRRLSEREELIFVTGAKPLRAEKLRYDEEPVFRARLMPAPEEARRRALPSPWAGISSLGFAQRRAPDASPGRDGAIVRALSQEAPLRSRAAPEQQQGDLLSVLEANAPSPDGETEPPSQGQASASSRFALRPSPDDTANEAGS